MVSRNGVALPARLRMRPLHDIDPWPVVLEEVEIRRREAGQWMPQVAYRRYSLQKYLRQQHRRTHVEVDASIVQLCHQRAEQAEIAMTGRADCSAVRRGMRV